MRFTFFMCLCCALMTGSLHAQDIETGFQAYGSYSSSNFDTVNLQNGNLVLRIPLLSYPQRGQLPDLSLSVGYQHPGWLQTAICDEGTCTTYWALTSDSVGATVNWLSDAVATFFDPYQCPFIPVVQDGTGARHAMGFVDFNQTGSPFILQAIDGSGYTVTAPTMYDSGCHEYIYGGMWPTVMNRQGIISTFWQNPNFGQYGSYGNTVSDRSGNSINSTNYMSFVPPSTFTLTGYFNDSLGRTIPLPSGPRQYDASSGKDIGFVPGCYSFNYPGPPGPPANGTVPVTYCYSPYTISSQSFDSGPSGRYTGTFNLLHSVALPNGQTWTFDYDTAGDLATLTLPTGGTISYTWQFSAVNSCSGLYSRGIQYRDVNANDGTSAKRWTYSINYTFQGWNGNDQIWSGTDTVTDPEQNYTVHTFNFGDNYCYTLPFYETETQSYNADGTLASTVDTTYSTVITQDQNTTIANGHSINRIPMTITTTSNGQVSEICLYYDNQVQQSGASSGSCHAVQFGSANLVLPHIESYSGSLGSEVERDEYDYGSGAPGPLLRKTQTQFQWQVNGSYFSAGQLDRPAIVTISDGGGGQAAQTTYGYDEPENGNPSCVCGNLTSVTRSLASGNNPRTRTFTTRQGMRTQFYYPKRCKWRSV